MAGEYEQGARVGLGIKMAHEAALLAMGAMNGDPNTYLVTLDLLTDSVVEHVVNVQAKYGLTQAFPGATVEQVPPAEPFPAQPIYPQAQQPAPQQYVPQAQPQYVQPQPAPVGGYPQAVPATATPIPGAAGSQKDAERAQLFQLFLQDPSAWTDQRATKSKPTSPDFKHRSMKQPGTNFFLSLWLKDAPDFAVPTLRQMGLVA